MGISSYVQNVASKSHDSNISVLFPLKLTLGMRSHLYVIMLKEVLGVNVKFTMR